MGERKIDRLEALEAGQRTVSETKIEAPPRSEASRAALRVTLSYPEPTPVSVILQDIALWSGRHFVLEPSCNKKLQIFSAVELSPREAYHVFLQALSTVGLRAVEVGQVTKVVRVQTGVMA